MSEVSFTAVRTPHVAGRIFFNSCKVPCPISNMCIGALGNATNTHSKLSQLPVPRRPAPLFSILMRAIVLCSPPHSIVCHEPWAARPATCASGASGVDVRHNAGVVQKCVQLNNRFCARIYSYKKLTLSRLIYNSLDRMQFAHE